MWSYIYFLKFDMMSLNNVNVSSFHFFLSSSNFSFLSSIFSFPSFIPHYSCLSFILWTSFLYIQWLILCLNIIFVGMLSFPVMDRVTSMNLTVNLPGICNYLSENIIFEISWAYCSCWQQCWHVIYSLSLINSETAV